jgi:hypothetical protein
LAQFLGQYAQRFLQLAAPHPLLEPSMHGLARRIHAGQFAPLRPGAQNPQHSVQYLTRVSRRPAAPVGTLRKPQQRLQHRPIRIRHLSPTLAFVVPRHRQCHFFCAVICTKTQAQKQPQLFIGQVLGSGTSRSDKSQQVIKNTEKKQQPSKPGENQERDWTSPKEADRLNHEPENQNNS